MLFLLRLTARVYKSGIASMQCMVSTHPITGTCFFAASALLLRSSLLCCLMDGESGPSIWSVLPDKSS